MAKKAKRKVRRGRHSTKAQTVSQYLTYNFVDKDPVIDELRTRIADAGLSWQEIKAKSGVSVGTMRGWFTKNTRRPQSATVEAVGRAIGYKRIWVKFNKA